MVDNVEKRQKKNIYLYFCQCCDYKCSELSKWKRHTLTAKHQNNEKVENVQPFVVERRKNKHRLFYCKTCDYTCSTKCDIDKHCLTAKHQNNEKVEKRQTKMDKNYYCQSCNYKCSTVYNFNKHMLTAKHQNNEKKRLSKNIFNSNENFCKDNCIVVYKNAENLMHCCEKSSKKGSDIVKCPNMDEFCNDERKTEEDDKIFYKNMIVDLMNQNKEIIELCKTPNNINPCNYANHSYNNNNNKTFNLNFFLNETCKNAMNITEFVESLQLQLSDLESVGRLGFVDGISNIIVKNLKALDETQRPIHCTDKKRETVYVKDENKWEKEDENKTRLRKAINYVANENTLLIPQWKAKYPDYNDSSSICSDQYNNMIIEVLGGEDSSDINEYKIIKKIAREVIIDK
jgi:hypothetical protein